MTLVDIRAKIIRTKDLLEQLETQWYICEPEVLRDVIKKLQRELEELYVEERKATARKLRDKRSTSRTR